ncbi:MAG: ATP-binding protein [Candidatus Omnitrophica bacterium]|nr:ATP-binding protein [Candidatus Omnitrophota bacterium]
MKKNIIPKVKQPDLKARGVLFQELMDNVPDVVYFKDKKGRLIYVNRAHARGLGLEPEQVVGKTDFDFFPRERAMMMAKDDRIVIEKGRPIIDKVERATRPDGVDNYVSTTKVPRFDAKGNIIGLIGITRDITHRQQLETLRRQGEKMKKQLESLREIDRMKTDFISVVSHELRTPLAITKEAITLTLDGVKGELNPGQKNILLKAKNNTERLKKIIEELLEISRLEKGKTKLHYSLINLGDLITELCEYFKQVAAQKGLTLACSCPNTEINIFSDADKLTQILTNLIENAIKFTENNGSVNIEVKVFEDKVRFGVIDTGVGILKQDQSRIFDRFLQVTNPVSGKNKGMGLGLSIVKELVRMMGGEIWVESSAGIGSKFYFTIPRFYTASFIDKDTRSNINELLKNGISLYLLNVQIVRYREFQALLGRRNQKLLNRILVSIEEIIKEFCCAVDCRLFASDFRDGECGIIFTAKNARQANSLALRLKKSLSRLLANSGVKNIFFNMGLVDFGRNLPDAIIRQLPANIKIQKINIGANKRGHSRLAYKLDIEVVYPDAQKEESYSVDLSLGGICFTSDKRMLTDSRLSVKIKIPAIKKIIEILGRVAWISENHSKIDISKKYKIGLEFVNVGKEEKNILSKFLKSIRT